MKQLKNIKLFTGLALVAAIMASCHKDKVNPDNGTPTAQRAGLYVLNQGNFGQNNSTLTYYDFSTLSLVADQFTAANANKLGDTGNDAGVYGSKMFITVNNSNVVTVVAAKTAKLLKQVTLSQPRSIAFFGSNAFVTSYNGTVSVIDTTSLTITKTITVGPDPEQMVVSNGKLYVANSGGLNPTPNTTVSVIDPVGLTVTKTIIGVVSDPVSITADNYGHVYVLSLGNFGNISAGMTIISNATDAVTSTPATNLSYNIPIISNGDFIYYFTADNKIAVYNAKTQAPAQANFITDGTAITTPFAISADSNSGEIFVTDAKDYASNGTLYAFDKNGKKEYAITVGVSPGKIVLVNK